MYTVVSLLSFDEFIHVNCVFVDVEYHHEVRLAT